MKSMNLNLKSRCAQCNSAKERKRIRLDREDDQEDENIQEEVAEQSL